VDGFVTGPNAGVGNPLGDDDGRLHDWMVATKTDVDAEVLHEVCATGGAILMPLAGTLVLSGPRITELCRLDSPDDIDLAARAVRIPRVKTDAAERVVPMVPTPHEILLGDRIARRPYGSAGFPDA
jgi:hypothetical protein